MHVFRSISYSNDKLKRGHSLMTSRSYRHWITTVQVNPLLQFWPVLVIRWWWTWFIVIFTINEKSYKGIYQCFPKSAPRTLKGLEPLAYLIKLNADANICRVGNHYKFCLILEYFIQAILVNKQGLRIN